MGAELFRYIFENISNAIVMTGCTWNRQKNKKLLYVYSCEILPDRNSDFRNIDLHLFHKNEMIDLFIMGTFSIGDSRRLLYSLHHNSIQMVILPYVAPEKRKKLLWMLENIPEKEELERFIEHPDRYMKETGVPNYYFICGNGTEDFPHTEKGTNGLEPLDSESISRIISIEGSEVPLRKAGFIVKQPMVFYLCDCSERDSGDARLAMFCTLLEHDSRKMDSIFKAMIFDSEQDCHADISEDDGRCSVFCMLYQDHETFRYQKGDEGGSLRLGVLALGRIDTHKELESICKRFKSIYPMVRILAFVGNEQMKEFFREIGQQQGRNALYCICPAEGSQSPEFIKDIVMNHPRNRILFLSQRYGGCMNGYIKEKELFTL